MFPIESLVHDSRRTLIMFEYGYRRHLVQHLNLERVSDSVSTREICFVQSQAQPREIL
jgi:hypothetical protein